MVDPKRGIRILQWVNRALIVWCLVWIIWDLAVGVWWFWPVFQAGVLLFVVRQLRLNRRRLDMIRRFEAWAAMREKARWN